MAAPGRSLTVTVTDVVCETADACSLVFGGDLIDNGGFDYRPGQFVTIRVPSDQTGSVARCYSLASSPLASESPKVTVKRTETGYASNWLCDNVSAGDVLEVLPPSGRFTPKDLTAPLLLLAAGSGITPMMSIVKSALASGSESVVLVYANRSPDSVIFGAELVDLARDHSDRFLVIHLIESLQGLPHHEHLAQLVAPYTSRDAYMCGPAPFMESVRAAYSLAGASKDRLHAEVFASLSGDPFADADSVDVDSGADGTNDEEPPADLTVNLDGEDHRLSWPRSHTLVDVMLSNDIDVPYSCRSGECGSCACTVLEGSVAMPETSLLDDEDIAGGYVLGCQARPTSDSVSIEF